MTSSTEQSHWNAEGKDPNADSLRKHRMESVRQTRRTDYLEDRSTYLAALVAGKDVLDCGIVAHTLEATQGADWLHDTIRRHAKSCLGVDILEAEIAALQQRGYHVQTLDVTKEVLPESFEVILACEIIEHIDNLGSAFENWSRMLKPGGRLVITTPNPWYINCMLKNIRVSSVLSESVDHVGWHEPATMYELGSRYSLRLDRYTGLFATRTYTLKAKVFFKLARLLVKLGIRYELFSKSLVYEFVKVEEP